MSADFFLGSWFAHLPMAASCIDGDGRRGYDDQHEPRYYALAEDWKGSHCPYPKLPDWARQIFDARVRAAYWWTAHYHDWQLRAEHLMLGWRWPEPRRRRVVLLMRRIDDLFGCRRRGYSWHFHCSLCGGMSFFDLAGSRWACSKCGRRNPAAPKRRPRFSLLRTLDRWHRLRARIDNRPKWVCCRWCGKAAMSDSQELIGSDTQGINGKDLGTVWRCSACYRPEQKIVEYFDHRRGYHVDDEVRRLMDRWRRTGALPEAVERHWEAECPF